MSKELPPSRTAEQFVVRFPDGMRARIAEAAKANGRSMNAEIVARLQASFPPVAESRAWETSIPNAAASVHALTDALKGEMLTMSALVVQQKRANLEALRAQAVSISEELRLLHNPLAASLERVHSAKQSGDKDALKTHIQELDRLKDRMSALDARAQAIQLEIDRYYRELKDLKHLDAL